MKTQKMSLANIQGKLSRTEMKNIMAGSGSGCGTLCFGACTIDSGPCKGPGTCATNQHGCFCSAVC